jgi:hypothetical protein
VRRITAIIPAFLIILAAFGLRAYQLGTQSVWFDEGWSWHLAALPLDQMAAVTAADRSPALFYALLHIWMDLAGQSEFALRFLSVCADVVTVALVIALAQRLAGSWSTARVSHVGGLLYALSPFAVWYAQETRMYALLAALCTASSYWLWRWLRRPMHTRALFASAALLAVAVHVHYYAIFLLPAHAVAVLLLAPAGSAEAHRAKGVAQAFPLTTYLKWLVAAGGVVALLVPWLLFASTGFAYDDGFIFPLNTVAGRIEDWVRAFASGQAGWPLPPWWEWALVVATAAGVATFAMARRWRALLFMVVLVVVPLLAATLAVRLVYPYRSVFHPRYLIYVVPVACVLIGGLAGARVTEEQQRRMSGRTWLVFVLRLSSFVVMGALWLPALYANYADPRMARDDVRGAVKHVVEALAPGDVVVMTRDNYAVRYYLHNAYPAHEAAFVAAPEGLHGVLKDDSAVVEQFNALAPKRVRLFLWQDDVVDPQKLVESTLWAHGYEIGEFNFGQNRLPLYQVTRLPMQSLPLKPITATFGGKLGLTAYWMPTNGFAGDWFYAVLVWTPYQKLNSDYKVFVHVWDAKGQAVFQHDKRALNDLLPMSSWVPGSMLRDPYAMVIPPDLPPGEYNVAVGVYDPTAQGARLPVQAAGHAVVSDAVILGTLQVQTR